MHPPDHPGPCAEFDVTLVDLMIEPVSCRTRRRFPSAARATLERTFTLRARHPGPALTPAPVAVVIEFVCTRPTDVRLTERRHVDLCRTGADLCRRARR
ncbi:hypothetical protein ACFPM0_03905 [Pseudonocardia sulfidoxydans]|uniref:hypothetical protein n=1 Tax=Pseudonocardia sulfidoxydans TaxID=54011 RepID=UPI00361CAE9F